MTVQKRENIQDTINVATDLNTTVIPKEQWTQFLDDFSKRRYGWLTKVEVLDAAVGDQILSEGLSLNGIVHSDSAGKCSVEISLGDNADQHQTHSVAAPVRIAYLNETETSVGVLEIAEADGTKTLIGLLRPMPVSFGYKFYGITVGA